MTIQEAINWLEDFQADQRIPETDREAIEALREFAISEIRRKTFETRPAQPN